MKKSVLSLVILLSLLGTTESFGQSGFRGSSNHSGQRQEVRSNYSGGSNRNSSYSRGGGSRGCGDYGSNCGGYSRGCGGYCPAPCPPPPPAPCPPPPPAPCPPPPPGPCYGSTTAAGVVAGTCLAATIVSLLCR